MQSKLFHIYEIMSAYSGILFPSANEDSHAIGGVYNVLSFMCGENLQTLALPRVAGEAKPYIKEQLPWVEDVAVALKAAMDDSGYKQGDFEGVAMRACGNYGTFHALIPMHHEDHEVLNPIEDYERLGGNPDNVIEIDVNEPSQYGDLPPSENEND